MIYTLQHWHKKHVYQNHHPSASSKPFTKTSRQIDVFLEIFVGVLHDFLSGNKHCLTICRCHLTRSLKKYKTYHHTKRTRILQLLSMIYPIKYYSGIFRDVTSMIAKWKCRVAMILSIFSRCICAEKNFGCQVCWIENVNFQMTVARPMPNTDIDITRLRRRKLRHNAPHGGLKQTKMDGKMSRYKTPNCWDIIAAWPTALHRFPFGR